MAFRNADVSRHCYGRGKAMHTLVGTLLERAERVGAAISVFDYQDRIVGWNRALSDLYEFVDFSKNPKYENLMSQCLSRQFFHCALAREDPREWLNRALHFHQTMDFAQFVRRLSNGRILMITYEKIAGCPNWSYQARMDITTEVTERVLGGQTLLGFERWGTKLLEPSPDPSGEPPTDLNLADVLEAMPAAAALIGERGKLLDANHAFQDLLRRGDGLSELDGRVVARDAADRTMLNQRLSAFLEGGGKRVSSVMRITGADPDNPYFVSLSQIFQSDRAAWDDGRRLAMMTVSDPRAEPTIDPGTLAEFLQITLAEAQIAVELGAGKTVQEIARKRNTSAHTVYCQVKSILGKTGFKGQTDIARRVVGLSWAFGRHNGFLRSTK